MSNDSTRPRNLKGTWKLAIATFLAPILGVFLFRWLIFEPFVIPSGSMIPTLLVHDHILVNKLAYGVHWPFTETWIAQWSQPQRGEIAVFKFPQNKEVFYVKRIAAVGGDDIAVKNGRLVINGEVVEQKLLGKPVFSGEDDEEDFEYYLEKNYTVRYRQQQRELSEYQNFKIPPNHFFVVGDNRDQSSDSRFWGVIPESYLVGYASIIWLSCDKTLPSAQFLCDPQTIRWKRLFKSVQ